MRFVMRGRTKLPHHGSWSVRLRRASRWIVAGILVATLVVASGTIAFLWRSGAVASAFDQIRSAVIARSADMGMTVHAALLQGRDETSRESILAALGVVRGQPLLAFDPAAAKQRLERLSWVREAAVERRFPGTIAVRIVERRPLALWQRDGKLALVDDTGTVIEQDDIARFASLPIIVGDEAPRHAAALVAMLTSEPRLKAHVRAAVWVADRRWNLHLDNGIDVRLPEERPEAAWARLADLDRTSGLLQRDLIAIDLRMNDRLILQLSPAAARRLREPGADT